MDDSVFPQGAFFEAVRRERGIGPMYDAAIVTEDGVRYWHEKESNRANNSHSATKFFTCACVGVLADRGALSVTDPVTSFFAPRELPEDYDRAWDRVTVADAMRHKTGIEHIPYGVDEDSDIEKIGPDFLRYVFSLKIEHEPGTFRRYSDAAYYLLSRIVSSASGQETSVFLRDNILAPLGFHQWAAVKCPAGFMLGCGGFFTRADDTAKLGLAYALGGEYMGRRIVSEKWVEQTMANDYACTRHRDTDIFVKTGAKGQMIAFSPSARIGAAWHGCSDNGPERNDRLLDGLAQEIESRD